MPRGTSHHSHGGLCYRDYLHPVSSTNNDLQVMSGPRPYYERRDGVDPTDTCGDLPRARPPS